MSFPLGLLGDHVAFSNGKSSPDRHESGAYPVYGSNGLIGFADQSNAPADTSVIGRVGTYCGSIHFSSSVCWVTDNAIKGSAKNKAEARFWYYAMLNCDLHSLRAGSGQPLINQTVLKQVELPIPPQQERIEIAAILGALDDKIALNLKVAATLEAMARALYRSWFVDFDPVIAKSEGRAPDHMSDAIAAIFPDKFAESGLPEGWERLPIGSLIEDTIGGDWGKDQPTEDLSSPVWIIRGTDFLGLQDGGLAGVPMRFTSDRKAKRRELQPDDIVLEVSGGSPTQPTGRSLIVTKALLSRFGGPMVPASFCRRLRPTSRNAAYLSFLHMQQLYEDGGTWDYQNQSTGISNFQTPRFLETEFVNVPPKEVLDEFSRITESLFSRMYTNENQTLTTMRDTLLPRLMSGDLRVGEVREQVEETAG